MKRRSYSIWLVFLLVPMLPAACPAADEGCFLEAVDPQWRPAPGIHLTLSASTDSLPAELRFILSEVSAHPGTAVNSGDDVGPDIEFQGGSGFKSPYREEDSVILQTSSPRENASAVLVIKDGAASGQIRAEMKLGGAWQSCRAGKDGFRRIPVDDNGNGIADVWEQQHNVMNLSIRSDDDQEPRGDHAGDGFSNYEEYRGFVIKNGWISTDPLWKDLFVDDEDGLGLGYFRHSGLRIHMLEASHYGGNGRRVVTLNREALYAPSLANQHAIRIRRAKAGEQRPETAPWYARIEPGLAGPPNFVKSITIDLDLLIAQEEALSGLPDYGYPEGAKVDVDWLLAHQIGHAVGLTDPGPPLKQAECPDGTCLAALWEGAASGDEKSVMRLHFASHYQGRDGHWYVYPPDDKPGTRLCSSGLASGINDGPPRRDAAGRLLPISGSAAWPNSCRSKIRLSGSTPTETPGYAPPKLGELKRLFETGKIRE